MSSSRMVLLSNPHEDFTGDDYEMLLQLDQDTPSMMIGKYM